MKTFFGLAMVAVTLVVFIFTAVFLFNKSRDKPVVYVTAESFLADIVKKTVATGQLVPRKEIEIKSQVSGVLEAVYVVAGQKVNKGDLIAKIEGGFLDFDCCIATPDVMQKISKVARKLGPRGLMPSPKNGTVTNDVKKAVSDALKGKADFKNDKGGTVHCLVGKVNFETEALLENAKVVIKAIKDAKPENAKGKFVKAFYVNSTMGPSVEVAVESV
jgi:large subunit ribosomal protein L1